MTNQYDVNSRYEDDDALTEQFNNAAASVNEQIKDVDVDISIKADKLYVDEQLKKVKANLFDLTTISSGYLVNTNGTLLASASYGTTDFIQVLPGTGNQYFASAIRTVAFYDANKNFITSTGGYLNYNPQKFNCIITAQTSARYMRLSATLTDFQKEDYRILQVNVPSRWSGKNLVAFGDSLTEQGKWQPLVCDKLGFIHRNYGIGGAKVADTTGSDTNAMCRDERINALYSIADVITFLGFTNDWLNNVPLGVLGSVDTTTAYGALNVVYQKIFARFPTTRIIAMTPPYSKYPDRNGWTDTTGITNNLGLKITDYGQVTKDVSKLYGIPVIDLYENVGWNELNYTSFVTFDGAYLHPNNEGAKRIAELMGGKLSSIEPLY